MKPIILTLLVCSIFSCTVRTTEVVDVEEVYLETADPVVVAHGTSEELIGQEFIQIDTVFPNPGNVYVLENLDMDEISCDYDYCLGTYTETIDLLQFYYDIEVWNSGTLPAYGLSANLRVRYEEEDPFDPGSTYITYETINIYMADILEPDWEILLTYTMDPNEEVIEFLGLEWDDYGTYAEKLEKDPEHYNSLAKIGKSKKLKITKRKKN